MISNAKNISPTIMAVGGIDPSGGAGLFMDNLAVASTGCLFSGVCSTVTRQNGILFQDAVLQPAADVLAALELVYQRSPFGALKTGALGRVETINHLCDFAHQHPDMPVVVDPVLKSSTGGDLFSLAAMEAVKTKLIPISTIITPNLHEAAFLTDMTVETPSHMEEAARRIVKMGAQFALIKGGHLENTEIIDVLADSKGNVHHFSAPRLPIGEVRGTGCALASLIAAYIALGESLTNGVKKAQERLRWAMAQAKSPGIGPRILNFCNDRQAEGK